MKFAKVITASAVGMFLTLGSVVGVSAQTGMKQTTMKPNTMSKKADKREDGMQDKREDRKESGMTRRHHRHYRSGTAASNRRMIMQNRRMIKRNRRMIRKHHHVMKHQTRKTTKMATKNT